MIAFDDRIDRCENLEDRLPDMPPARAPLGSTLRSLLAALAAPTSEDPVM